MKYLKISIIVFCLFVGFISCNEDYISGTLTTKIISNVETDKAVVGGILNIDNGNGVDCFIIENGILCSSRKSFIESIIGNNHYWTDSAFVSSSKEKSFSYELQNLQPNTHYYICAYTILHSKYSKNKGIKYENIIWGNIEEFITKEITNIIDTTENPIHLDKPTNVTATFVQWGGDLNHIRIAWNEVEKASSYEVWRSNNSQNDFSLLGAVSNYNIFEDGSPFIGNNYYKVRAVNGIYKSDFSDVAYCNYSSTNYDTCPPNNLSVNGNATSMTITWGYTTNPNCGTPTLFKIYKRNHYTGSFNLIDSTANYSYTEYTPNITPGYNQYAVVSKNNYGESNPIYELSPEIPLSTPTNFSANKNGTSVTFSWDIVSQATGYKIFMGSTATGNYFEQYSIENNTNSYTANFPYASGTIYFKVKAVYNPPSALPYGGVTSGLSNYVSVTF